MSKDTLQEDIEQIVNRIAVGANRSNLPANMVVLIPSLDLQKTIDQLLTIISKECDRAKVESYKKGYIAGGIAVAVSYRDHTTQEQINEMKSKLLTVTEERITKLNGGK